MKRMKCVGEKFVVFTSEIFALLLGLLVGQEFMRRLSASILAFCTCSDTVAQKVALSTVAKLFSKFCDNGTIAFVESSVWEQSIITTLQVLFTSTHYHFLLYWFLF